MEVHGSPQATKMVPRKWCPKVPTHGVLASAVDHILEHFIPQSINPEGPSNPESPSNPAVLPILQVLQVTNQQLGKGASGMGEALRYIR